MRVLRRIPNILYDTFDGRATLIDADGTELIELNRLGTLVWDGLDGERSSEAIAEQLAVRFDGVEPDRVASDVEAFLDELQRLALVEEVASAGGTSTAET